MPDAGKRTLILLRHGESTWNRENRFTGWMDAPLSGDGRDEARRAGRRIREEAIQPWAAHTSMLRRAIHTLWLVLDEIDAPWLATCCTHRLNERHYGALQGSDKAEIARIHGAEATARWRRSFTGTPPPLAGDHPDHPRRDRRYRDIAPELLPSTESLADTQKRVLAHFEEAIAPDLARGPVLVVAHGNSLRSLIMRLEDLSPDAITGHNVPTGIPLVYELDDRGRVAGKRCLAPPEELARRMKLAAGRP